MLQLHPVEEFRRYPPHNNRLCCWPDCKLFHWYISYSTCSWNVKSIDCEVNIHRRTTVCTGVQQCAPANNNVHRRTTMCTGVQQCAPAYNNVHRRTTMCTGVQQCAPAYNSVHNNVHRRTTMCTGVQQCAPAYNNVHRRTTVCTGIKQCAPTYNSVHRRTTVCTGAQQWFVHSFIRLFVCLFVCSFVCWYTCSFFVGSLVHLFVRSLVRSIRSFVRSIRLSCVSVRFFVVFSFIRLFILSLRMMWLSYSIRQILLRPTEPATYPSPRAPGPHSGWYIRSCLNKIYNHITRYKHNITWSETYSSLHITSTHFVSLIKSLIMTLNIYITCTDCSWYSVSRLTVGR